jgi:hypothetical protein
MSYPGSSNLQYYRSTGHDFSSAHTQATLAPPNVPSRAHHSTAPSPAYSTKSLPGQHFPRHGDTGTHREHPHARAGGRRHESHSHRERRSPSRSRAGPGIEKRVRFSKLVRHISGVFQVSSMSDPVVLFHQIRRYSDPGLSSYHHHHQQQQQYHRDDPSGGGLGQRIKHFFDGFQFGGQAQGPPAGGLRSMPGASRDINEFGDKPKRRRSTSRSRRRKSVTSNFESCSYPWYNRQRHD